ncbi:MAG: immune inhibitor A [Chloroflexi bacterium]|nr:immune inhibitor A [Chloroflexota bacterium]
MRIQTVILLFALFVHSPALAQDANFPTLEALAQLEIPAFSYSEMVGRMSDIDPTHVPPANPPAYEIGARDSFWLDFGEDYDSQYVTVELRGMTERVLIWAQTTLDYPNWRAQALARHLETAVLDPMQRLFQFAEPPGVDGDPRLIVAMIYDPDGSQLGYFSDIFARPKKLQAQGNEREMLVVNLALDDDYDFFDEILIDVVAHEYLHVLHHHSDFGEELWLDEALASYAGFQASKPYLSRSIEHIVADAFLEAPETGLTQWQADEEKGAKYGAGFLFITHLTQRFGKDIAARLLAEQSNGWQSVDKVLRDEAQVSADDAFADWVLANYFLDSGRGYGYRELDADLTRPEPSASYNSFPSTHQGKLPQYSSDYIVLDVRGADKLLLRLSQDAEAKLMEQIANDGERVYFAVPADAGHNRLTRHFDLSQTSAAELQYDIWYDLDYDGEYAFLTLSDDNGESWRTLRGRSGTSSTAYYDYYPNGYTGRSRFWRAERINLSKYAPGNILLRFELMSDFATKYRGLAIDNLRIDTIGFHDSFETPDDAWIAEGWLRTDNRLPNNTWLQVAQDTREGIEISRSLISGSGDLTVDILPGVSQVLVAVSPVVPQTGLPTEYELELNLMNAAGDIMAVSRECTVTTTHVLNFRASPNGNKIGLVPKAAAVDAFDRDGDWFKVEYAGRQGWIHADYVHAAGNCP